MKIFIKVCAIVFLIILFAPEFQAQLKESARIKKIETTFIHISRLSKLNTLRINER